MELLQEVRSLFEANDVEVVLVDKPQGTVLGESYEVKTQRCSLDYQESISNYIADEGIEKYILYSAEKVDVGGSGFVVFRGTITDN